MMPRQQSDSSEWTWENWNDFGYLNSGVVYISKDLKMTVYNVLAAQLLDAIVPNGQALPIEECLPSNREEYRLLVGMVEQEREFRNQIVVWAADGRIRHVLIDSFKREDRAGTVIGMHVVMKDLGNFAILEQHLQKSDRLATVGKIAAGIAHEIRNPLTTIKGFLQMMEIRFRREELDAELQYTGVMLTEIERVNELVGELLLLSKPHKTEKLACSMTAVLEELNPLIQSQALLRSVAYESSVFDVPFVLADASMMKQVILNLIKNALEAMEEGGTLRVSVRVSDDFVQVDVSDTGPGIPYYQMDKIFDAFFTTKDKGTGLGLPICQRIVADHGGEIRVSSKGYGTTFSVLLPVCSDGAGVTH